MDAQEQAQTKYLEIDHRMVAWCEKAVTETFNSIFECDARMRDVQIEVNPLRGQQFSGVLSFGQKSLEGVLSVSFSKETLESLATSFYKLPIAEISEEMLIGSVSEVTNVVFGLFREQYNKHGYHFQPAFPVVVAGANHSIFSTFPNNKLHLSFESTHGAFSFELAAAQGK